MAAVNPENSYLFPALVRHRAKMPKAVRERTQDGVYNMPWLFPKSAEREYSNTLSKYIRVLIKGVIDFTKPQYNNWVSDFHGDAYPGDIKDLEQFVNSIQEEIFGEVTAYRSAYLLKKAMEIDAFNVTQWGKFTGAILGGDEKTTIVMAHETWHQQVIDSWIERNEEVWLNVTREFLHNSMQIVRNGVENGLLWTNTRDKILGILPKAKSGAMNNVARANLIARNETGSLNSDLTTRRMQEAGLTLGKWLTAGDERVRGNPRGKYPKVKPSHYVMNSKTINLEDKTVISDDGGKTWRKKTPMEEPLQAGKAFQCRCTYIPIFRELLKATDKHIANNPFLQ